MSGAEIVTMPGQPAKIGDVLDVVMRENAARILPKADGKTHLPLVTTSELRMFRRCKRAHHYGYRLRYRDVDKAGPLRFGTAMHMALETWWLTCGDLSAALDMIDSSGEIDEFERAKARAMMLGYHARWIESDFEIVGVECQFEAPLINPETGGLSRTYRVGGKIDAIIRRPNGDYWIVEHKTAGVDVGFDSNYWKKLRLDPQISTYYVGARSLGYDVQGCLYDVLRKPSFKPLKATPIESRKYTLAKKGEPSRLYANQRETDETAFEFERRCLDAIEAEPDRHLVRGDVVRLEEDERQAAHDLWHQARDLREVELASAKVLPVRNPDGCEIYGRMCSFFPVCTGAASLQDPTLYRRAEAAHEELDAAPAPAPIAEGATKV